ncbi:AEC family transporter [Cereibacter sediminicola]|uniref:AEC family transporter n=1 Tax=Cereibacter sediminicola TaxID=2584941 RepID=UPI0011A4576E|nr:AEC family transporter [Cereibacter sediminicola]
MSALIDVILPVFLVIGFGYAAARAGLVSELAVDAVMRFAQNFAVPCLLFSSIARLDLAANYDLGLFAAFYVGAFTGFGLGFAGARYLARRPVEDCVAIGFACLFSNSLLLGLPITERAYGPEALASNYAIISIHSPLLYGFGITVMELVRSRGMGLSKARLGRQVVTAIFRQPLVIGISLGFVVNLTGLALPGALSAAVEMMSRAALPTALFGLGGVLLRYRPEGDMKLIGMVTMISLIVHPGIVWLLGRHVASLDTAQIRSAVVTAAMAPGVNAYLFSNVYGVAKRVTASAVLIATGASILTTWFWLQLLP